MTWASDPATRLPQYLSLPFYLLFKGDDHVLGRFLNCLVGVLILVSTYLFCRRSWNSKIGLIACFILATNPFFLNHSRSAFTDPHIYISLFMMWVLMAMSILKIKRTMGWSLIASLVLSLAITSKISAVILILPIFVTLIALPREKLKPQQVLSRKGMVMCVIWILIMCSVLLGGWMIGGLNLDKMTYKASLSFRLIHYALAFTVWLSFAIWAYIQRNKIIKPLFMGFLVPALSILTFFVTLPVHMVNPRIFRKMLRMSESNFVDKFNAIFNLPIYFEKIAFYMGSVLFSSSLIIGICLWLGFLWQCFRIKSQPQLRFPLAIFGVYFLFLISLSNPRPHYMMALLPILAVFTADRIMFLWNRKRIFTFMTALVALVVLSVDISACYPDYNLNGYQWLGRRYLLMGRSTIGGGSMIQIPRDGTKQALRWISENVRPDETIAIAQWRPGAKPPLVPFGAFKEITFKDNIDFKRVPLHKMTKVGAKVDDPDYILTQINEEFARDPKPKRQYGSELRYHPYFLALKDNYTKVYSVKRRYNIDVASVWKRNRDQS